MDIKFTIISGEILRSKGLHGDEKIVISIIRNFTKNGGSFFGKPEWLAEQIGRTKEQMNTIIKRLIQKNILKFDGTNIKFTVDTQDIDNIIKRIDNGENY